MLGTVLGWITGRSLSTYVLAGLGLAAAAYVAGSQLVLHNRQKALDGAIEAAGKLAERNATLTGQLDQVQALNASNLRVLAQMEEDHRQDLGDLQAALERAHKAGTRLTVVMQENARDPDASKLLADACPAMDRLLDRLSDPGPAAAPGSDGDPRGGAEAPGRPAGLRP